MRILERVELDKPIVMHDKLEVIWDFESDNINQYQVKTDLERLKFKRSAQNKRQSYAYQSMLKYIEKRVEPSSNPERMPIKIPMHEKEREFFDCLRLIIRNGYELVESDVKDLLNFIAIQEILLFNEDERLKVAAFLRKSMELLGFRQELVDECLDLNNWCDSVQEHYAEPSVVSN